MFPLNTDGIDISGRNATFKRFKITNFDDTIVPKPGNAVSGKLYADCTHDILVDGAEVVYGVGMSIGSVPPSVKHNCVKNITFRNVNFDRPLKAIYIKSNPGTEGSAIIQNITYENITMKEPIWWGIYIGPQQMKEPDGRGPGCMFYPLEKCETTPLVTIKDITLRNITSTGSILPAGIMRCNASNPCTNFVMEDVKMTSKFWDFLHKGFIQENVVGTATNVFPDPKFGTNDHVEVDLMAYSSSIFRMVTEFVQDPVKCFHDTTAALGFLYLAWLMEKGDFKFPL
jgi:polygalacturonase